LFFLFRTKDRRTIDRKHDDDLVVVLVSFHFQQDTCSQPTRRLVSVHLFLFKYFKAVSIQKVLRQ
jgi:hypothetical protein